ncbi:hypothetical protein CLF_110739 [Clonorchis sinensis]|uniref:Uncharacterized protein n=1 Tax=Clonorchis sinensis TaxID=79923 RepID=H2KSY2_CLOSI|nr:hypothetical protein CLF_110739 [Clonorchis sinensis]
MAHLDSSTTQSIARSESFKFDRNFHGSDPFSDCPSPPKTGNHVPLTRTYTAEPCVCCPCRPVSDSPGVSPKMKTHMHQTDSGHVPQDKPPMECHRGSVYERQFHFERYFPAQPFPNDQEKADCSPLGRQRQSLSPTGTFGDQKSCDRERPNLRSIQKRLDNPTNLECGYGSPKGPSSPNSPQLGMYVRESLDYEAEPQAGRESVCSLTVSPDRSAPVCCNYRSGDRISDLPVMETCVPVVMHRRCRATSSCGRENRSREPSPCRPRFETSVCRPASFKQSRPSRSLSVPGHHSPPQFRSSSSPYAVTYIYHPDKSRPQPRHACLGKDDHVEKFGSYCYNYEAFYPYESSWELNKLRESSGSQEANPPSCTQFARPETPNTDSPLRLSGQAKHKYSIEIDKRCTSKAAQLNTTPKKSSTKSPHTVSKTTPRLSLLPTRTSFTYTQITERSVPPKPGLTATHSASSGRTPKLPKALSPTIQVVKASSDFRSSADVTTFETSPVQSDLKPGFIQKTLVSQSETRSRKSTHLLSRTTSEQSSLPPSESRSTTNPPRNYASTRSTPSGQSTHLSEVSTVLTKSTMKSSRVISQVSSEVWELPVIPKQEVPIYDSVAAVITSTPLYHWGSVAQPGLPGFPVKSMPPKQLMSKISTKTPGSSSVLSEPSRGNTFPSTKASSFRSEQGTSVSSIREAEPLVPKGIHGPRSPYSGPVEEDEEDHKYPGIASVDTLRTQGASSPIWDRHPSNLPKQVTKSPSEADAPIMVPVKSRPTTDTFSSWDKETRKPFPGIASDDQNRTQGTSAPKPLSGKVKTTHPTDNRTTAMAPLDPGQESSYSRPTTQPKHDQSELRSPFGRPTLSTRLIRKSSREEVVSSVRTTQSMKRPMHGGPAASVTDVPPEHLKSQVSAPKPILGADHRAPVRRTTRHLVNSPEMHSTDSSELSSFERGLSSSKTMKNRSSPKSNSFGCCPKSKKSSKTENSGSRSSPTKKTLRSSTLGDSRSAGRGPHSPLSGASHSLRTSTLDSRSGPSTRDGGDRGQTPIIFKRHSHETHRPERAQQDTPGKQLETKSLSALDLRLSPTKSPRYSRSQFRRHSSKSNIRDHSTESNDSHASSNRTRTKSFTSLSLVRTVTTSSDPADLPSGLPVAREPISSSPTDPDDSLLSSGLSIEQEVKKKQRSSMDSARLFKKRRLIPRISVEFPNEELGSSTLASVKMGNLEQRTVIPSESPDEVVYRTSAKDRLERLIENKLRRYPGQVLSSTSSDATQNMSLTHVTDDSTIVTEEKTVTTRLMDVSGLPWDQIMRMVSGNDIKPDLTDEQGPPEELEQRWSRLRTSKPKLMTTSPNRKQTSHQPLSGKPERRVTRSSFNHSTQYKSIEHGPEHISEKRRRFRDFTTSPTPLGEKSSPERESPSSLRKDNLAGLVSNQRAMGEAAKKTGGLSAQDRNVGSPTHSVSDVCNCDTCFSTVQHDIYIITPGSVCCSCCDCASANPKDTSACAMTGNPSSRFVPCEHHYPGCPHGGWTNSPCLLHAPCKSAVTTVLIDNKGIHRCPNDSEDLVYDHSGSNGLTASQQQKSLTRVLELEELASSGKLVDSVASRAVRSTISEPMDAVNMDTSNEVEWEFFERKQSFCDSGEYYSECSPVGTPVNGDGESFYWPLSNTNVNNFVGQELLFSSSKCNNYYRPESAFRKRYTGLLNPPFLMQQNNQHLNTSGSCCSHHRTQSRMSSRKCSFLTLDRALLDILSDTSRIKSQSISRSRSRCTTHYFTRTNPQYVAPRISLSPVHYKQRERSSALNTLLAFNDKVLCKNEGDLCESHCCSKLSSRQIQLQATEHDPADCGHSQSIATQSLEKTHSSGLSFHSDYKNFSNPYPSLMRRNSGLEDKTILDPFYFNKQATFVRKPVVCCSINQPLSQQPPTYKADLFPRHRNYDPDRHGTVDSLVFNSNKLTPHSEEILQRIRELVQLLIQDLIVLEEEIGDRDLRACETIGKHLSCLPSLLVQLLDSLHYSPTETKLLQQASGLNALVGEIVEDPITVLFHLLELGYRLGEFAALFGEHLIPQYLPRLIHSIQTKLYRMKIGYISRQYLYVPRSGDHLFTSYSRPRQLLRLEASCGCQVNLLHPGHPRAMYCPIEYRTIEVVYEQESGKPGLFVQKLNSLLDSRRPTARLVATVVRQINGDEYTMTVEDAKELLNCSVRPRYRDILGIILSAGKHSTGFR